MSDDKSNRGPQDRARISLSEDYEVEYWSKKFRITADELREAVTSAGTNSSQAVADYLGRRL